MLRLLQNYKEVSSDGLSVLISYRVADSDEDLHRYSENEYHTAVNYKIKPIMESLASKLYKNVGVIPNMELCKMAKYDMQIEINELQSEVIVKASIAIEYINSIEADIAFRSESLEKYQAYRNEKINKVKELYKVYIDRVNEIRNKADIYKKDDLDESYISRQIRLNGYDETRNKLLMAAELYRVIPDGIMYVFKNSAYLCRENRAYKISPQEFIEMYNGHIYLYNPDTEKYREIEDVGEIKSFNNLVVRNKNRQYMKLSLFNRPVSAFRINDDNSISHVESPLDIAKNDEPKLYNGIDEEGIVNIILSRKNKTSNEQNRRREIVKKARKLGIRKSIIGKSEVLLIEILERYKAPDLKDVVEFVNDGPYISYYLSNAAVENNLTAAFDTIRVRFSVGHMEDKPGYRSEFIKQHIKSFNTIVLEVLNNSSKFRQSGAQINLFSCTKSLYKDGLFEYTFTLKKEIYDILKDNEDDTGDILALKHKRC